MPFAEVVFPFDPALQAGGDLTAVPVVRRERGPLIQETYTIDQHGIVQVRLADLDTGFERSYRLAAAHA